MVSKDACLQKPIRFDERMDDIKKRILELRRKLNIKE
jgi:hypothetical protein